METQNLEAFAQRHDFESWRGKSSMGDRDLVKGLSIPDGFLPGIDRGRTRRIELEDGTVLLRSTWQAEGGRGVHKLDIRECASVDEAHEVLLELLANMQAPEVKRLDGDEAVGDVSFAHAPSTSVVFARGNVAVRFDAAVDGDLDAIEVGRQVDGLVLGENRPEGSPA